MKLVTPPPTCISLLVSFHLLFRINCVTPERTLAISKSTQTGLQQSISVLLKPIKKTKKQTKTGFSAAIMTIIHHFILWHKLNRNGSCSYLKAKKENIKSKMWPDISSGVTATTTIWIYGFWKHVVVTMILETIKINVELSCKDFRLWCTLVQVCDFLIFLTRYLTFLLKLFKGTVLKKKNLTSIFLT